MHLKKLSIFGFKSFADRAELFFEPGVTTVVGPNGCGKSNISDSIRWVLGEENARRLRGERMDDLIFNGAGQRQGIGFAEVSLTLDNTSGALPVELSEVEITRKVYRSGESEYLINREPCRLRDIRELLMDTGIGVDSYSVVGQGQMDRILSSKPADRREVFEEAAGITKYKARKHEALLKLGHTEENIQRVNDILQEVKRQTSSLNRQAEKAQRYESKHKELKEFEIQRAAYELNQLRKKGELKKEERGILTAQDSELSEKIHEGRVEIAHVRVKLEEKDARFSSERIELGKRTAERQALEDRRRLNHERTEELEKEKSALERDAHMSEERVRSSVERIQEEEDSIKKEEEEQLERGRLQDKLRERVNQAEAERAAKEEEIEHRKQSVIDFAGRMAHQRNELAQITAQLGAKHSRHRRMSQELERVDKEMGASADALKQAQTGLEEKGRRVREIHEKLEDLKRNERARAEERARDHLEWVQARESLSKVVSKREFLEQLKERHEGFTVGVCAVLDAVEKGSQEMQGVRGVLAELIRVPAGSEQLIEKALGEDVQALVCNTRRDAERVTAYLKDRKAGRARVYSLDHIPQSGFRAESGEPRTLVQGEWKSLIEGVEAENEIMPLVEALLSRAWSGGALQAAWDCRAGGQDPLACWVTSSGEVIRASGSMEGGESEREAEQSLVARRPQIEALRTQQEQLVSQIKEWTEREEAAEREIQILREGERAAQRELREGEVRLANQEGEFARSEETVKKLQEEKEVLTLEISEILAETEELQTNGHSLNKSIEAQAEEDRVLQSAIRKTQNDIQQLGKDREEMIVELAQIETQFSGHQLRVRTRTDALEKLKQVLEEERRMKDERKQRLSEIETRRTELARETQEMSGALDKWEEEVRSLQIQIEQSQKEKGQIQALIDQEDEKLRGLINTQNELRNRLRDFDVADTQVKYEQDAIRERILQAFGVDLFTAPPEMPDHFDSDKAQNRIQKLKDELRRIGEVNLVAITEQKELQERFKFLTSQKEDLIKAKADLHQAINKINKTTRSLFVETFEKIQGYFLDYFTSLFGGGDARLVLLDERDVLESGIEIMVKPPGKKLRSISLLSGGEQALTATALMFSLFKVRPSPFCILDEIDAPLDEANIGRFTNVLEDFTRSSQFIVITHNKKTISVSDCIYGVTMQESGVSKVVSVKLPGKKSAAPAREGVLSRA